MSERVLQGLPASPGLGAGIVRRLGAEVVADVAVPLEARPAELVRAAAALADAGRELEALAERLRAGGRTDEADVVDTGALMALDPALTASLEREVLEQGLPAPAALVAACEEHAQAIAALPDELLAARAADVRSLGRRAAALAAAIDGSVWRTRVIDGTSTIGGGSAPGSSLPTRLLELTHPELTADQIEPRLRALDPPVIARIENDRVVLDLRTVNPGDDARVGEMLSAEF